MTENTNPDQYDKVLRVFVASPSDVADERDRLEAVVREINLTWGRYLRVYLELIRWETHTYPDIGDDAQDVVNKEVPDDYDIFIGILWTRFGTPTGRAMSGTAEEFQRAYRRYTENPNQLKIMFYFCNALTSPSDVDPVQLGLINEFRTGLGEKGVLWWPYNKRKDFKALVRMHLCRQMQEWGKSWGTIITSPSEIIEGEAHLSQGSQMSVDAQIESIDVLFDLIESGRGYIKSLQKSQSEMVGLMSILVRIFSDFDLAVQQTDSHPVELRPQYLTQVGYRMADEMAGFITNMEKQIPVFSASYAGAVDSLSRVALRLPSIDEAGQTQVDELLQLLMSSKKVLASLRGNFSRTRDTVDRWVPITPAFGFIKDHLAALSGKLSEEMDNTMTLISEAEAQLKGALKKNII